ncbi:MAG TPA: DUF4442 domain-containing protein [Bacteroidia bacterium]|jgi:hypothetical protein|nr:DUF4442 domain-containing protein [Bacteroidia bacterium]
MANQRSKFQKLVNNRFLFRLYLLKSLPLAYIAGIKVEKLDNERSVTNVKFKWLTQNPFRSMYFACMAMAAEMSTGLLLIAEIYLSDPAISMLIISNQAQYHKKAVGKIRFTCEEGKYVGEMVEKAKQTGDSYVLDLRSVGIDEAGDKVAEFVFSWSIKAKKSNKS